MLCKQPHPINPAAPMHFSSVATCKQSAACRRCTSCFTAEAVIGLTIQHAVACRQCPQPASLQHGWRTQRSLASMHGSAQLESCKATALSKVPACSRRGQPAAAAGRIGPRDAARSGDRKAAPPRRGHTSPLRSLQAPSRHVYQAYTHKLEAVQIY